MLYTYTDAKDIEFHEARKELTITSGYHDWHNTIADTIASGNYSKEDVEEYNENIRKYNVLYSNASQIDINMGEEEIQKIICENL